MFSIKSIASYGHNFHIAKLGLGPKSKQHPQTLHPKLLRDKNIHREEGFAPPQGAREAAQMAVASAQTVFLGVHIVWRGDPKNG